MAKTDDWCPFVWLNGSNVEAGERLPSWAECVKQKCRLWVDVDDDGWEEKTDGLGHTHRVRVKTNRKTCGLLHRR